MSPVKPTILVTGGAGYIGSHAVLALQGGGYDIVILDNLVYGHQDIVEKVLQVSNGNGYSVKQVIETASAVTGREIKVVKCDRRPGDPPALIGSSEKAKKILGWSPQYTNLDDILSPA